jgi:8-oxo-dGTP pyrophosphatase MutT (NUDIX family)
MVFKNRPVFLANLYNFVGGKIEESDANPVSAAFRETLEESNIITDPEYFGKVEGDGYVIHLCRSFTSNIFNAKTMEDEEIEIIDINEITNLQNNGLLAPNIRIYLENALHVKSGDFFTLKDSG